MKRSIKSSIAGAGLAAVVIGGVGVPVVANAADGGASSTSTSSSSSTSTTDQKQQRGPLGLDTASVAKAAGTSETDLMAQLRSGKTLAQVASSHGVSQSTLVSRLGELVPAAATAMADSTGPQGRAGTGGPASVLSSLVSKGTISQAQADAITKAMESHRPDRDGGRGGRGARPASVVDTKVAALLKMSVSDLHEARHSGRTLTQIAQSKGVSKATLVSTISSAMRFELPTLVTQQGMGGPGGHGGERGPGGHGPGGPGGR